jgi:hypothetical protein
MTSCGSLSKQKDISLEISAALNSSLTFFSVKARGGVMAELLGRRLSS